MNWNEYFRQIAHTVKLKSKDNNTQIGAVIVGNNNEIVSTGYNSFPRGINDDVAERQERPEKYYWFEHAERNAIYNAARIGVSTRDCTMFLTCGIPCVDCSRGIINAGIRRIVCEKNGSAQTGHWEESIKRSILMFNEANVRIEFYDLGQNKHEPIEYYMKLMPSGIPENDDTWCKLRSWLERNIDIAETWKTTPPTIDEEEKIYNVFGCNSPITCGYVK